MLKKIISWGLGVPAAIISFSECEDLHFWWVPFLALGILVAVLAWNGVFKKEEA